MASSPELQAALITGRLWAAICASRGPRSWADRPVRFPATLDPGWLAGLPLPTGSRKPPAQPVALLADDTGQFERHTDPRELAIACRRRPRTQVHESIGRDAPGAWYAIAARHLGRLAGSELEVVCSLFVSACGDVSLGTHHDTWHAAIVQVSGVKHWQIPGGDLVTSAGDILLIPKGFPHAATTPADPGHSVHLSFAIHREQRGICPAVAEAVG